MIYFDNAATALNRPQCVIDAVCEAMKALGNPGRGAHDAALAAARTVHGARREIAKLLGAEKPSEIAFTENATGALNAVIMGLFSPGDEVITTVCEHNSVLRPLRLIGRAGVKVRCIGADKNGMLHYEEAEKLITPQTKAFIIGHASNVTGNIADLEFFRRLSEKYGIYLIVDGAQSAGAIPVNVRKAGIDIFCFTGHKAIMGPQGTGGVYIRDGIKIRPLKSGGSGSHSFSPIQPERMPEVLEAGTLNCHGIAGLKAAAEYINSIGVDTIQKRETELTRYVYRRLTECDGITVYGDFLSEIRAPVVSFNIRGVDAGIVCDRLNNRYGIAARGGAHCAPLMHKALGTDECGAVRFSFGIYNTREEADIAIEAVREIEKEEYI